MQILIYITRLVIGTIWLLLPAYFANSAPVVFPGNRPLDGNRRFRGRPLLGAGKTVGGTLFGLAIGLLATLVLLQLQTIWALPQFLPAISFELGVLLTVGALLGDISASFFKRRLGFQRGSPLLVLDQLDFYLGAMLLSSLVFFDYKYLFMGLLITPPLHRLFNLLAFKVSLKSVSW